MVLGVEARSWEKNRFYVYIIFDVIRIDHFVSGDMEIQNSIMKYAKCDVSYQPKVNNFLFFIN